MAALSTLYVLATEGGIPGSDWRAKIAVPLGLLIFVGSVYLLVRSNLGTRRGYLVMGTSLWGFMVIYALFWTFGAPGTPPATGPQNLPGQELDAYEPLWRAFAGDSLIAGQPEYAVAKSFPEGFAADPVAAGLPADFAATGELGVDEIFNFFSTEEEPLQDAPVGLTWAPVPDSIRYAKATNGRPIIAVTYQETYQPADVEVAEGETPPLTVGGAEPAEDGSNVAPEGAQVGDLAEGGETYTAFGFFDAGAPLFPSFLMLALVLVLFVVHALLLARDENRERRERTPERVEEPQRVTTGV
ncbi:MAG: hypothetical protein M3O86_03665 [Actinomycetota bacterium]|nr:hypothetical protein [Actinomycetota bacterium]